MKTSFHSTPIHLSYLRLYPTFKEWKQVKKLFNFFFRLWVYILPLRNENLFWESKDQKLLCLYPTFKEWKLFVNKLKQHSSILVYILPLRNENHDNLHTTASPLGLYPTFKEWKLI